MRPRLVMLLPMLLLVACTTVTPGAAPPRETVTAPASPLPAADAGLPSPADTPAAPVICTAAGDFVHCRDAWLELEFEYPVAWGEIAEANRRPGGYAGLSYEYSFRDGEPWVFAGGRSRDFSEGRGGMYTDQLGFGNKTPPEVCLGWGAALCQPVQPGVMLMVLLPRAEYFCGDAMALSTTPRALIALDLPQHPQLHGFGFTASLLPPGGEEEVRAQLGFTETDGPRCTTKQQAAFDQRMAELRQGLDTATAPAEIQARYDAALHLAESLHGTFLGPATAGCAQNSATGIPVVDAVVDAVCAGDDAGLEALVRYSRIGCTYEMALGGPPACRPGEAEGTLVDGIAAQGTEGVVVRRDEIAPVIAALLARDPAPLALDGDPQESYTEPGWPWAKYALVFAGGTPPLTTTLLLDDAGIVRLYTVDAPAAAEPRFTGQPLLPVDPRTCPATVPNGSTPPGEQPSAFYHGSGALWTALWPAGRVLIPADGVRADGTLEMKFPWWRGTEGPLTVSGRRLDAPAPPLQATIPEGYGAGGFQASSLLFPTTGCWEVNGSVGAAKLTFITEVVAP